ncbi:Rrf2 family transcriptional regulator, partial [bacterium]
TTEYALRIVVYLASLEGRPATTAQIAGATRVPADYLAKILRNLARGGLVTSTRGAQGGSTLARPAAQMTVLDVVQLVDPIRRIKSCPLGLTSHAVSLCPLHSKLDAALAAVESAFREATIAEMVAPPARPRDGEVPTSPASGLVTPRVVRRAPRA